MNRFDMFAMLVTDPALAREFDQRIDRVANDDVMRKAWLVQQLNSANVTGADHIATQIMAARQLHANMPRPEPGLTEENFLYYLGGAQDEFNANMDSRRDRGDFGPGTNEFHRILDQRRDNGDFGPNAADMADIVKNNRSSSASIPAWIGAVLTLIVIAGIAALYLKPTPKGLTQDEVETATANALNSSYNSGTDALGLLKSDVAAATTAATGASTAASGVTPLTAAQVTTAARKALTDDLHDTRGALHGIKSTVDGITTLSSNDIKTGVIAGLDESYADPAGALGQMDATIKDTNEKVTEIQSALSKYTLKRCPRTLSKHAVSCGPHPTIAGKFQILYKNGHVVRSWKGSKSTGKKVTTGCKSGEYSSALRGNVCTPIPRCPTDYQFVKSAERCRKLYVNPTCPAGTTRDPAHPGKCKTAAAAPSGSPGSVASRPRS